MECRISILRRIQTGLAKKVIQFQSILEKQTGPESNCIVEVHVQKLPVSVHLTLK